MAPVLEHVRYTLAMGEPPLYILVGEAHPTHQRWGPWDVPHGTQATKVHVISPAAGGEIRGYWLVDGKLRRCKSGAYFDWPELDTEVTRVTGLTIV